LNFRLGLQSSQVIGGAVHAYGCIMATRYLSRTQVAERIGVQPDTLGRYKLPEPDALIGTTRGWLPKTIDAWNATRPGRVAATVPEPAETYFLCGADETP
jgi:hypothetical protein